VGGNALVYETRDDLILVDCGLLFPSADQPGIDYLIPDLTYVMERQDKLRGIVLTHGHEDHLGALPYVLPRVRTPVYATRFTRQLLAAKVAGDPDCDADLRTLREREPVQLGGMRVEAIAVAHSIPDAVALAIHTPCGVVVHTGDFKLDDDPPDGRRTDLAALQALGDRGVLALLSDSTNAERPGHTTGERSAAVALDALLESAPFRVLVTAFASNITRLQAIVRSSERLGRKVILVGRSVQRNVQLARESGLLEAKSTTLLLPEDFERVPRGRATIIAGGSQGETHSSLHRIAGDEHGIIKLEPGDRAIFSSRRIPGNERAVSAVVNNLCRLGVEVIDDHGGAVHASGHACNDEQREMIRRCRPRFFVPIHGEVRHLRHHAALAQSEGIPAGNVFVLEDGQPLAFEPSAAGVQARRLEPVPAGLVFVDGKAVGDVNESVVRERRILAEAGVVSCVIVVNAAGDLTAGPMLTSRGFISEWSGNSLMAQARDEVTRALATLPRRSDEATLAEEARVTLRRFFRRELDRKPVVLPVVITA